jgi:hypothetical protein
MHIDRDLVATVQRLGAFATPEQAVATALRHYATVLGHGHGSVVLPAQTTDERLPSAGSPRLVQEPIAV